MSSPGEYIILKIQLEILCNVVTGAAFIDVKPNSS